MISVVIATFNDERTLGQTLAALVPAAVDGLVREVILADSGSTDAVLEIAEDAGARVVQGEGPPQARIAEACRAARSDWLMILEASAPPPAGWEAAALKLLKAGPGKAAFWGKALPWPLPGKASAVLVPRRLYDDAGGYGPGFLRRLGSKARPLRVGRG